ncbi:hypothetical protein GOP47_0009054 [Adiantum capillus-veneris]|uniref:Uncharacterized protein n=1 Tax=Adiantum capillus-veneris TaxID=13818 RepID=A0A9D4ZIQ7_ADICA|nr:hypothetical protein GOP47_0009054 [Adiantum capillus-veneris]
MMRDHTHSTARVFHHSSNSKASIFSSSAMAIMSHGSTVDTSALSVFFSLVRRLRCGTCNLRRIWVRADAQDWLCLALRYRGAEDMNWRTCDPSLDLNPTASCRHG